MANPNVILHVETPQYVIRPVGDQPPMIEVAAKSGDDIAAHLVVLRIQGDEIYNFLDALELAVNAVERMPRRRRAYLNPKS